MYGIKLDERKNPVLVGLKTVPLKDKAETEALLEENISRLNTIYRQIPKPCCSKCGSCCDGTKTGNPRVYSIEYLNLASFLNSASNKELKLKMYGVALMGKALLDKREEEKGYGNPGMFCPALDPKTKLCLIYEHRPLICRLYGLSQWNKERSNAWVQKAGQVPCDKVKISEDDQTEFWDNSRVKLLLKQLESLSIYHYFDESKETIFNKNLIITWFTLNASLNNPG